VADAFEEADLRAGFEAGGRLLGAFIVARDEKDFVVYVRPDWVHGRGFRIIRKWRRFGDRTFRRLDSALDFIRQAGWPGRVMIYPAGDEGLAAFAGVSPRDLVAAPSTAASEETVAPGI
jgi:hypothetical protein